MATPDGNQHHTMMQNPMPHNMLPPTNTNTPASIRFQPHPQNCNQTSFRGAPGSILKILCILKVPNKKEKFVFIIQNSFQLSRRDCEVFNKQNSAAAWRRGRNTTTLLHSSNKRTKEETENCSRGEQFKCTQDRLADKRRKVGDKRSTSLT